MSEMLRNVTGSEFVQRHVKKNWAWRTGRAVLGMLGSLQLTIAAVEKTTGEPVTYEQMTGILGPGVAVGLAVVLLSNLLTSPKNQTPN